MMFHRSRPSRQRISVRTDDDPDRADVVGGAGGFVHGQEIEVGTAADGSLSRVGQARKGSFGRKEGLKDADGLGTSF
jgi:hypothetical protein